MAFVLSRFRGRSLAELRLRGLQAVRARLERLQGLVDPRRSSKSTVPYIEFRGDRGFASLFSSPAGAKFIVGAVAHGDAEAASRCRALSDGLQRGVASLLGHGFLPVGNPPRWHTEMLSGRRAPLRHWSRIDYSSTDVVGDYKVLWELNRHQYLLAPAFCWVLDGESGQFDLIQSHLESWLTENPTRLGVNWVSSLELAYRAITWCWLLWILRDAPWRTDLRQRLTASLEAHALHIERYLSTYFSPNTHLTGEALGLFYVGTLLPASRHAERWRAKGAAILETCLDRQVHSDGVYFEQATQYHRYTAEIYLHYQLLGDSTGWAVSRRVRETLGRLLDVLRGIVSGAGKMPLLGDDDGGLLLPLDHRAPDDIRALLLAGAVVLGRPELIVAGETPPTLAYWLCGVEETDRLVRLRAMTPAWFDIHFADGGIAILRDGWGAEDAVAVIDAGPHGALSCGHSHADALAMTLAIGPTELFVDRGTLTYTGSERDEFRSTESHNTLEIDGESSVTPGRPFKWGRVPARPECVVSSSVHFSGFTGLAAGHVDGERPSAHRRMVLHQRSGAWLIHDSGTRRGAHRGVVRWQLAVGLTAEITGPQCVVIRNRVGKAHATVFAALSARMHIAVREVSLRLGHRVQAQCLEFELDASLSALTIIVPASQDGVLTAIESGTHEGSACFTWADGCGRHRLTLAAARTGSGLPIDVDADLIWHVDRSTRDPRSDFRPDLVAAMAVRSVEPRGQGASGTMIVWANRDGLWARLAVDEPRRGRK